MSETKYCKRCDRTLPIEQFHRDKKINDGHTVYCKECVATYGKKYRATAAGIYSNIKGRTKFFKNHKFDLGKDEFVKWYEAQELKCVYCDITEYEWNNLKKFKKRFNRLTVDCIDNEVGYRIDNIVLACGRCNLSKNDLFTYDEFREIAQKYIKPKWKKLLT